MTLYGVQSLIDSGDDQINSQFLVYLRDKNKILGPLSNHPLFLIRMNDTFQIPDMGVAKTEIMWRGMKIPKTLVKDEMNKEITLKFRVDQTWIIYDIFYKWMKRVYTNNEGLSQNEQKTRLNLMLFALGPKFGGGGGKQVYHIWEFQGCKITNLKVDQFQHSGGEPINIEVTFIFWRMLVKNLAGDEIAEHSSKIK